MTGSAIVPIGAAHLHPAAVVVGFGVLHLPALPSGPRVPSGTEQGSEALSNGSPAKFFVNSGLVANRVDIHHLLRPLLKQTVSYRYLRSGSVISHGTGWVERIVMDRPDVSSFFTPLSICLNVDSWEHLEFETRPDQLLTYRLVQGDEQVILEFAPTVADDAGPVQQKLGFEPAAQYVQMTLSALDADEPEADDADEMDDLTADAD